jgi:hypothetical protein
MDEVPNSLYELYYEQSREYDDASSEGPILTFPAPTLSLAFDDSTLKSVQTAWERIMRSTTNENEGDYMVFQDRDGAGDDDL